VKKILYYDFIPEYNRQKYKDLLTAEHVVGTQIKIDKLSFPDGDEETFANFWGYELQKGDKKYLLEATDRNGNEIVLNKVLPIKAKLLQKVAHKGIVYYQIMSPTSAKIRPVQHYTFKEFVGILSSFSHSNPEHQKLNWFIALSHMYDRSNFAISTPPGFGKDGTVDVLSNLIGGCGTIETPTIAKLEERASVLKWLAVNEIVDLSKDKWRIIEGFVLSNAAHKPTYTKQSRAFGNVKEVIDTSQFSLSLMYNDITNYSNYNKYFDYIAKEAVLDRLPRLRLYGVFTEDFNKYANVQPTDFVKKYRKEYDKLIETYEYYRLNYYKMLHNYTTMNLIPLDQRHLTNINRLLKIVNVYSDTQEEYNKWVDVLNKSIYDYKAMIDFPVALKGFVAKMEIPKIDKEKLISLKKVTDYCSINKNSTNKLEVYLKFLHSLNTKDTFIEKVLMLNKYKYKPEAVKDVFWDT